MKLLTTLLALFMVAGWFGSDGVSIKEHTALVDLQGVIAADQASADSVNRPRGMMRTGAGATFRPRSQHGQAYLTR